MASIIDDIIGFWFGELDEQGMPDEMHRKMWFSASRVLDKEIDKRYRLLVEQARKGQLHHWAHTAQGLLATLLLLDQFSRNIYRGQAQAFAADPLALAICRAGVKQGLDQQLLSIQRAFFYMPLEHAESLEAQDEAVALFRRLQQQVNEAVRPLFAEFTDFAHQHREIIARFGRFPHRNRILNRDSTTDELDYLAQDAPRFGQA